MTNEDGTVCSETSAHKIQPPGNHPKEIIEHIKISFKITYKVHIKFWECSLSVGSEFWPPLCRLILLGAKCRGLSRIFDPTGEEVTVSQWIFMNVTSRQILVFNSKSNETGGAFACVGGQRNVYKILV